MARFTVHIEEKKKRQKRFLTYFLLLSTLLFLFLSFFFDNREGLMHNLPLFIAINGIWIWIESLRNMERPRFVEINEQYIEWLVHEKSSVRTLIEWKDIRWIKKEQDASVTIFQDSSFEKNLSLITLAETDQNEILQLVEIYANQRQIRLVNFSQPALALA